MPGLTRIISPTEITKNVKSVTGDVEKTYDNPQTGAGGGIDVKLGAGGASVRNVTKDRTDYDIRSPRFLPIRASGGVSENRKTQEIDGGHIGGGVGTKGVGIDVDAGYHNCAVSVDLSYGVSLLGVNRQHLGFTVQNPFCNPSNSGKDDSPVPVSPPDRNYFSYNNPPSDFNCSDGLLLKYTKYSLFYDIYNNSVNNQDSGANVLNMAISKVEFPYKGEVTIPKFNYSTGKYYYVKPIIKVECVCNKKTAVGYICESDYKIVTGTSIKVYSAALINQDQAFIYFTDRFVGRLARYEISAPYVLVYRASSDAFNEWFHALNIYQASATTHTTIGLDTKRTRISTLHFGYIATCGDYSDDENQPKIRKNMDCCNTSTRMVRQQKDDLDKLKDKQDKQDNDLEELKKQVKAIYQVLNPPELLDGKTSIPKRFIYPDASGQETVKDYPTFIEHLYRMIDRYLGIPNPEIKIADANPEKGINQPFSIKPCSIGDMLKILIENTIESEADIETIENLNIRQTFLLMQILKTATSTWHLAENLEHYMDYHVEHSSEKVKVPFNANVSIDGAKDLTRTSTRKLLIQLLQEGELIVETTKVIEKKLLSEMLLEINKYASAAGQALSHEYRGESTLRAFIEATLIAKQLGDYNTRQQVIQALGVGDMAVFNRDLSDRYAGSASPEDEKDKSVPDRQPSIKKSNKNVSRKKRGR